MTDTSIGTLGNGDAYAYPYDEGIGSIPDGDEPWGSAGKQSALSQMVGSGGLIHDGLTFAGHDGTNDTVDVTAGRAYVMVSGASVQSAITSQEPSHDSTLPFSVPIALFVPTDKTALSMTDSSLNDVWIAFDTDGTGPAATAGDIYLRHGTGLSAPSHPSVKLGQTNPDSAGSDVLDNRDPDFTFNLLSVDGDIQTKGGGTTIWDSTNGWIPQTSLENDSVTVAGNSVSLGGSTAVSVADLSDVASSTENAGHVLIWNATNGQYENAGLTGGTAIDVTTGDASITVAHANTSDQADVSAAAGAAITDITLDTEGHTTGITTTNFDGRYVLESGDTVDGALTVNGLLTAGGSGSNALVIEDHVNFDGTHSTDPVIRTDSVTSVSFYDGTNRFASFTSGGYSDFRSSTRAGLPTRSTDPAANVGDMWYRTDLD